ncbi:MAG: GTP cyclohydrolase I [Candidatus Azotimanducaceae bacterium]
MESSFVAVTYAWKAEVFAPQGEETVTSSMLGALQSNQALRAEFFALARET